MTQHIPTLLNTLRDVTLQVKTDASGPVANAGAAAFTRHPSPERWSAAQCLEHLNRYGDYYLPLLEEATSPDHATDAPDLYKSGLLGGPFAKSMRLTDAGSVGRAMRSPKAWNPVNGSVRANVLLEFLDQQERYLAVIENARGVDVKRQRIPLSVARFIKISLGDMLQVLVYHNQRHMAQARRAVQGH